MSRGGNLHETALGLGQFFRQRGYAEFGGRGIANIVDLLFCEQYVLRSHPLIFMNAKRILAYGEDSLVIFTRAMILQKVGYDVTHTTCAADLAPLLKSIFFDLVLIGDSLRTRGNVRLAQRLREQFPKLLIAMVQDENDEHDPWSSAFVSSTPEQMLSAIQLLLESNRKPVASNQGLRNFRVMRKAAGG